MGHQLIITGVEAVALANELAMMTGESIEGAVTVALRARLSSERDRKAKVARIMSLAAEIRAGLGPMPSTDMSEFYDENGLPA